MIHIKLFEEFDFKDYEKNNVLHYYSFDIDDNLLHTKTKIVMEHFVDGEWIDEEVDTEKFAQIRTDKDWRFKPGEDSFVNFRDWGPRGKDTFLIDFKYAVENRLFAPSWTKFIECLVNGYIFSIITSRGHSPNNVRRAIYWLIYEYGLDNFKNLPIQNVDKTESFEDQMIQNLLDFHELFGTEPEQVVDSYLELCPIYTISSKEFAEEFYGGVKPPPEPAKKRALIEFNNLVQKYADKLGVGAKLGFSDDDHRFVKAALDQFIELKDKHKNIDYSVFDTGGDKTIKKLKV